MRFLLASLAFVLFAAPAFAAEPFAFDDAFIRETPMAVSAGYIAIKNNGQDDALQSVSAEWADKVQLHEVKINDSGVLQMLPMKEVPIKAGQTVTLAPGGSHIMLYGVKGKLKAGDVKTMTLHFAKASDVKTSFTVRPITYRGKAQGKKAKGAVHDMAPMDHMKMGH